MSTTSVIGLSNDILPRISGTDIPLARGEVVNVSFNHLSYILHNSSTYDALIFVFVRYQCIVSAFTPIITTEH